METVLNEKDNQGNTTLHLAVLRKQYEVVNLLLSNAALKNEVLDILVPPDILLQFQSEAGDKDIETTLVKAGSMRSSDMASSVRHESSQSSSKPEELEDFFKYKKGRDKPSDVRTALLTVAALILAATYQAALSPPSGLGNDNEPPTGSGQDNNPPTTLLQNTERTYSASSPISPGQKNETLPRSIIGGKSVLAKETPAVFILFLFCNSIGFYTAGYTILFLTRGFPMQLEFQVSMLALGITYATSMQGIIPGKKTLIAFSLLSTLFPIFLPFILRQVRRTYYRPKKDSQRNDTP
ncbi:hypothetical protein L6164_000230 [Bauhinia variegata]|uniref:Uncharacterized protein n=1 Tax=Bauhinia variegata TaxID=167791 RepID=A0ACB9Q5W2_BAUVA|nr:hypothetical protein L6164_000230 [Bauhinia variegata]